MNLRPLLPALVTLVFAASARADDEVPPAGTGAFRHVLELAGAIGPRKTGSDAERRAIEDIAREMESAGGPVARPGRGVAAPHARGRARRGPERVRRDPPG